MNGANDDRGYLRSLCPLHMNDLKHKVPTKGYEHRQAGRQTCNFYENHGNVFFVYGLHRQFLHCFCIFNTLGTYSLSSSYLPSQLVAPCLGTHRRTSTVNNRYDIQTCLPCSRWLLTRVSWVSRFSISQLLFPGNVVLPTYLWYPGLGRGSLAHLRSARSLVRSFVPSSNVDTREQGNIPRLPTP